MKVTRAGPVTRRITPQRRGLQHLPQHRFGVRLLHPASTSCIDCHATPASHSTAACGQCHASPASRGRSITTRLPAAPTAKTAPSARRRHAFGAVRDVSYLGRDWGSRIPAPRRCTTCHRPQQSTPPCPAHRVTRPASAGVFTHSRALGELRHVPQAARGTLGVRGTKCHRVGTTWAFYHPNPRAAPRVTGDPANHYGTSCASCHSTSTPWSKRHVPTPGDPRWRTHVPQFACTSCHPNGYSSATCTKCHDSSEPDKDDD